MSEEIVKAEPGDAIISSATGRVLLNVKGKLQLFKEGGKESGGGNIGTKYETLAYTKAQQEAGPIVISADHDTYVVIEIGV